MPKLYIFVVCEKVIIDQAGVASLIGLFNKMVVSIPEETSEIPANAVAPKEWVVFAGWLYQEEDEGKEYTQNVEIFYPDGSVFIPKQSTKFIMNKSRKIQNVGTQIVGFPLGQQGQYPIRMWLEAGEVSVMEPVSIYTETEIIRKPKAT